MTEVAGWTEQVRERVLDWIADDPDPVTREELSDLLDAADRPDADGAAAADLVDRFGPVLAFGTAGLRGRLGGGPHRMNLAVVVRAAAAITEWLLDGAGSDPAARREVSARGVVIGFDARHRSAEFAEVSAEVFAAAGVRALVLPGPLPTPVTAFAVRHLGAAAGVMVTASHNPAVDNGYKVYDGSGRQIVAPDDARIASAMADVVRATAVPRTGPDDPDLVRLGDDVIAAYVDAAVGLVGPSALGGVMVAHTAMHGVGTAVFARVADAAGLHGLVEVADQAQPDPAFPTLAFPNPEEPGALDHGLALAASSGAQVLLANDPDADRLGVAVPDPALGVSTSSTGWRALRGDEIGVILADHLLRTDRIGPDAVLATTIVSSTLLGKMAAAAGVPYVETLTGFKWVSRAPGPGQRLGFGYEEALGFCVGDLVGDKDGITAGLLFAEVVAVLAAQGRTVLDVLDDLARRHGLHATGQRSVRFEGGLGAMTEVMAGFRADPPTEVAGRAVLSIVDLLHGDEARHLPPSDVLVLHLERARVIVRPSGTEPKLKAYVEVVEPVADESGGLVAARARGSAATSDVLTRFVSESLSVHP